MWAEIMTKLNQLWMVVTFFRCTCSAPRWIRNRDCCWRRRQSLRPSSCRTFRPRSWTWSGPGSVPETGDRWDWSSPSCRVSSVKNNETRSGKLGRLWHPVLRSPPYFLWCRKSLARSIRSGGSGNPFAASGACGCCLTTTRTRCSNPWPWWTRTPGRRRATTASGCSSSFRSVLSSPGVDNVTVELVDVNANDVLSTANFSRQSLRSSEDGFIYASVDEQLLPRNFEGILRISMNNLK